MPCYHPIMALQPAAGGPLVFPKPGTTYLYNDYNERTISCGQCAGCRLKRSREWAMRCIHEKQMHKHNCFITVTYSDETLPANQNLIYRHFQLLMRRVRKHRAAKRLRRAQQEGGVATDPTKSVRFYMAGEYSEPNIQKGYPGGRPHFHALLFNLDFTDKLYLYKTPAGEKLYRSPTLEKLWKHGFSSVGELTFKSAAYVARYIMAKRTGDGNKTDYEILDLETGEITKKKKEFNNMSRRPGVGSTWIEKYKDDVYTTGKVIVNGHKNNPPRYYDKQFKKIDQLALEEFQYARYLDQLAQTEHHTPERLAVQEQVAAAKTKSLKRHIA